MKKLIPKLLWIDSLGALLVGVPVVLFRESIAVLHNLPLNTVVFLGVANLVYGCFSLSIAVRKKRSVSIISTLAIANILWAPICWILYSMYSSEISLLGTLHILGESLYVGMLGIIEYKNRNLLIGTE